MKEPIKKRLFLTLTHFGGENETGDKEDGILPSACGDADRRITGASEISIEDSDAEREFEELIKGRYASAFSSRVQRIIDKRFKQTKLLEARASQDDQFRQRLSELCGGDSPEAEDLLKRVGELVSQKEDKRRSPEELTAMERDARKVYPSFDLDREMTSEAFRGYVERGLDLTEAYALTHLEEIRRDAQREGARQAVLSIASMGKRPDEGGRSSSHPPIRRRVSDLDSSEIKKLIERASKGEKIKFKDI